MPAAEALFPLEFPNRCGQRGYGDAAVGGLAGAIAVQGRLKPELQRGRGTMAEKPARPGIIRGTFPD